MKKTILLLGLFLISVVGSEAKINLSFTDIDPKEVIVRSVAIDDMLRAKNESELSVKIDTISVAKRSVDFELTNLKPAQYSISLSDKELTKFYASQTDNVIVKISGTSVADFETVVSGTQLIDGMNQMTSLSNPLRECLIAIQTGKNTIDNIDDVYAQYCAVYTSFIEQNPNNPASAFALLNLDINEFAQYYNKLGVEARQSILYPFVEQVKASVDAQLEKERKQEELSSGDVDAPEFSLPDRNGKMVKLSDYKGKWLVLDFWGSWCGWCIKGFPEMKKTYEKYGGKVEFIGIDCGDSQQNWLAAVEKHQLPWVQLYNDENAGVEKLFMVSGFPTKIIVSPDGKIKKIVTGEDPQFYLDLDNFVNSEK